jgi:enoyl-CoA hydratase/carnithine racemase
MGLVNRLVPAGNLSGEVYGLAEEIASNAPLALKGIKRILGMLGNGGVLKDEQRKEIEALQHQAYSSRDFAEGQAAFFEKRKPVFTGR